MRAALQAAPRAINPEENAVTGTAAARRYAGRMIQVCSRCGTRWNVRDQQRVWCPRCRGQLLAPSGPPAGRPTVPSRPAGRLPAGFRWIAVRPGPPPPHRRPRKPLGPTPRYQAIPRWGLVDRFAPVPDASVESRRAATPTAVRATLLIAAAVFAVAAVAHILRYLLLLINRNTLLNPLVANGTLLMGVLASLAALVAVIATAVVTTSWLIVRRSAAFARFGRPDPRPEWSLWAGCVIPVVNLVWAPVFVIELAHAEQSRNRLRGRILAWWIAWIGSTALSAWAIRTSGATQPQAIADNTVTVILAYLAGLAVLALLWRLCEGFFDRPVERPAHRWVIVPEDTPAVELPRDVESEDREPAA